MAILPLFTTLVWQTKALVKKNLVLYLRRKWFSTAIQAYILPLLVLCLVFNAQNFGKRPPGYGIGTSAPVRSFRGSLEASGKDFIIVSNDTLGPDVETAIGNLLRPLEGIPNTIHRLRNDDELAKRCTANLRGISNCYGALIFDDSPLTPGRFKTWNYTIRSGSAGSSALGFLSHTGFEDTFWLPFQLAVDNAILNSTQSVDTYGYTRRSQATQDALDHLSFLSIFLSIGVIAACLAFILPIYHAVNAISTERALGMSKLVDAMGGSAVSRVVASCLYLNIIYLPTWLIAGVLFWYYIFVETNAAVPIFWSIFTGFAFTNSAVFAAAFFDRRVISSVVVTVVFITLSGVSAYLVNTEVNNGTVIVLSLLFPASNFVFAVGRMIRFPLAGQPIDMATSSSPTRDFSEFGYMFYMPRDKLSIPVYAFWLLLVAQIVVYPVLAVYVERILHGISFKGRTLAADQGPSSSSVAVETTGLRKVYPPKIMRRIFCCGARVPKPVTAVDGLSLVAHKKQVLCLLGVNGSGKTTTLDLIAGLQRSSGGEVRIGASSTQLGICPQKNVLHPQLTVLEHVKFWRDIKGGKEDNAALHRLIEACDLSTKMSSRAGTLSGGQKRKLQLACMFVGGSLVCLMDEVTTGLDPLSRRVIWNIILAERSKRTMLFTTHFLDEGEVLADHIVLLSKGNIKCQGSGAELKNQYGGGYQVHIPRSAKSTDVGIPPTVHQDRFVYNAADTKAAGELVAKLEAAGHTEVALEGPTIEKVFLALTKDVDESIEKDSGGVATEESKEETEGPLASGRPTSTLQQVGALLWKRLRTLRRFWIPTLLVLIIGCVLPALFADMLRDYQQPQCDVVETGRLFSPSLVTLSTYSRMSIPMAPLSANETLFKIMEEYPLAKYYRMWRDKPYNSTFAWLNDYAGFQNYVTKNTTGVDPGGLFMGDSAHPPTIAYMAEYGSSNVMQLMNLYTNMRAGQPIGLNTGYVVFSRRFAGGDTGAFWVLFAVLIYSAYPAFFALYPALEKSHNIRQLQYQNGVRPLSVWLSHLLFDSVCLVIVAAAAAGTVTAQFKAFWFAPGWIFLVVLLYNLATILLTYLMARISRSQLSAFLSAFGLLMLMYVATAIAFMLPQSLVEIDKLEQTTDAISFSLGLFLPTVNLWKAFEVGLNVYKVRCRDRELVTYPGAIYAYGGPIFLLVIQILAFGLFLVYLESNRSFGPLTAFLRRLRRRRVHRPASPSSGEDGLRPAAARAGDKDKEAAAVVGGSRDLLRLSHVSKTFGGVTAVDDVSLALGEGEILALLGPNGAGKTTVANMVVGGLTPDGGQVLVGGVDVHRRTREAQRALGVCPQFDALDLLTAREHLEFYGRVRGVPDVAGNVARVMARLGLTPHAAKLPAQLSGGNKRKLSLGIALMGNPGVLVLDEPSSAMDAAAKRAMWKMLAAVAPGRSVLLTTHSMEEADALATRAAILAKRLLAIGTTQELRARYSNLYHVTLVLRTAPESAADEMHAVETWVRERFADVAFEGESLGGQVRFVVPNASSSSPVAEAAAAAGSNGHAHGAGGEDGTTGVEAGARPVRRGCSISDIIAVLEANKEEMGVAEFSIGAPTLERVFLSVVRDNYVEEEEKRRPWWRWWS